MTDAERAALVYRATTDLFASQPDRETFEKARRQVKTILAAIEPAIRADEREACARIADAYAEANKEYGTVSYSALPAIAREIRALTGEVKWLELKEVRG